MIEHGRLGQIVISGAFNAGSTSGVSVTPAFNSKGAWAEITADALPYDIGWIDLSIFGSTAGTALVDIAYGDATTKVIAIPDLFFGLGVTADRGRVSRWPIYIPRGNRIYARAAASFINPLEVAAQFKSGGVLPIHKLPVRWRAHGINPAQSTGTAVDPGTTPNTKGAWISLGPANSGSVVGQIQAALFNDLAGTKVNTAFDIVLRDTVGGEVWHCTRDYLINQYVTNRAMHYTGLMPANILDSVASTEWQIRSQADSAAAERLYVAALYTSEIARGN